MFNFFDLIYKQLDGLQKLRRVMIMQNIKIHAVITACQKSSPVVLNLDTPSHSSKNECSGEYSLQVPSGHLQRQ